MKGRWFDERETELEENSASPGELMDKTRRGGQNEGNRRGLISLPSTPA
jgi:hypothetical protein